MTPEELSQLFVPHILERRAAIAAGKRLVHYTSADAAFKIVTGRKMWLRNAQMMNDYSEIQHGIDCLSGAWRSPAGVQLQEMLERIRAGLRDELVALFDNHADGLRIGTFITSLSEHEDNEDQYGRLSMWRAYGGRSGVALVLNGAVFASETDVMHLYSSPVFYQDVPRFVEWFQGWAKPIIDAEAELAKLGDVVVRNALFTVFRFFALCTKHPAFAEEKEWRVFNSPVHEGGSEWLEMAVETIGGVPQILVKLQLKDDLSKGVTGVDPLTLLNRVIIGPCEYPLQVRAALVSALETVGFENAVEKMCMSLIPLRHR